MPLVTSHAKLLLAAAAVVALLSAAPARAASPKRPTPTPTPTPAGSLHLTITDPSAGLTIPSDRVNVHGTFIAPPNSGITVNDLVAFQSNGEFAANDIPLTAGTNTIRVVATSPAGESAIATVVVGATASPPAVTLQADVTTGLAPLTVTFSYDFRSTAAVNKIAIDFDGDGRDDFQSRRTVPTAVQNTYSQPGVYLARLTLTDAHRRVFTATRAVEVGSSAGLDDLFLGVWNAMNDALLNQDVSRALRSLNSRAAGQYAAIFQDLLPDMPAIIGSYSRPQRVSAQGGVLEYAVNRTIGGEDQIFFIYLLRDADGVWRIDGM